MQSHYFVSLSRKINSNYLKKIDEKKQKEEVENLIIEIHLK